MADLDIVDEFDNVTGRASYEEAHSKGLRHRSVNILVFQEPKLENLLIARRSEKQEVSAFKLHPSAGGHVKLGQSYLNAALDELHEELFHLMELPRDISLVQIAKYKNNTRPTNKENTCLFYTVYAGPFSIDKKEIKEVYWKDFNEVWKDMNSNPKKYTATFLNAMKEFRRF